MRRALLFFLFSCSLLCCVQTNYAQPKKPPVVQQPIDTNAYVLPPADSARIYDSIYKERWEQVKAREKDHTLHPHEDFYSFYITGSFLNKVKTPDLSQYFAERIGRSNPVDERNTLSGLDRYITLGGVAQITNRWGIFVEYDFIARYFSTDVEDTTLGPQIPTGEHELDLTTHTLLTGATVTLYDSRIVHLRANGGIGATYALASESEEATGKTRSASAAGLAVSFDVASDFRITNWGSFTIDLFARSISTGTLKVSGGDDLSAPFGSRTAKTTIAPHGSFMTFGLAIGAVFYLPSGL